MTADEQAVLVVEDHASMREFLRLVLDASGYTVLTADSTSSAMATWREHEEAVTLLIADLELPGGSGLDLCQELAARRPPLRTLLISGHSGEHIEETRGQALSAAFLRKPFSAEELLRAVHHAFPPP